MYAAALFVQRTRGLVFFHYYEYMIVNYPHGGQGAEQYRRKSAPEPRFF